MMMPLARRMSLVVVLLLVASVGTASGECAWVLWVTVSATGSADYREPSDAYTAKEECERTRTRREAIENESRRHMSGFNSRRYFACLPDTVDPREPQRGAR